MKAPSCSSRINKTWVQYVIKEHLKKKNQNDQATLKVDIKNFTIDRGAMQGDAFNSELVTLDVTAVLTRTNSETGETSADDVEFHFMVKFLSTEAFNKLINQRMHSSTREYTIYAEYINKLNTLLSSHSDEDFTIHIPELIYGKLSDDEFVLVMENIKYSGYNNNDKYKGLDFPHLKEAVSQLARLHALSYIHNKSQPILEKYPFFEFNIEAMKIFVSFFGVFIENGIALLNAKGKGELAKKIQSSKENLVHQYMAMTPFTANGLACSGHGDFWNNNIMYKEEEVEGESGQKASRLTCKIVDWGTSSWLSPVYDLQYLMYTSTTRETRQEHLEEVLSFYHTTFTDIVASFDQSVPNWSYDDFSKEWRRLAIFGFFMGMSLSQGTLSESNPVNKPKDGPSVLDYSFCFPAKFVVDGMKFAFSKLFVSFMFTPLSNKLMSAMTKKMFAPIRDEILSGSNEVMNKRILDLLLEGEELGLYDKEPK